VGWFVQVAPTSGKAGELYDDTVCPGEHRKFPETGRFSKKNREAFAQKRAIIMRD
jgi:hypothetical protein